MCLAALALELINECVCVCVLAVYGSAPVDRQEVKKMAAFVKVQSARVEGNRQLGKVGPLKQYYYHQCRLHVCVCVCVCVKEGGREREREVYGGNKLIGLNDILHVRFCFFVFSANIPKTLLTVCSWSIPHFFLYTLWLQSGC